MPLNGLHVPEFGEKALDVIARAKSNGAKTLKSGVEVVITTDNLEQIIPTVKESLKYKIDFLILSHLIPYSPQNSKKVAYETNNEEAVKIFKKWVSRLETAGYTIDDWLELMKKKALPEFFPEENEPMKLFKSMYDEAASKGLTLHMQNLINRDDQLINTVRALLQEVENICRKKMRFPFRFQEQIQHHLENAIFLKKNACM